MTTRLRAKRLLLQQGRTLVLVLGVVGLLAVASGGYVYATPPTETVTERVDEQSVSAEIQHAAEVTGETTLYDRGERLDDASAYLFSATPVVQLDVVTAAPSGTDVDQRLTVELSATNNGEVFWSDRQLLGTRSQEVAGGESRLSTSLNVSQLSQQVAATRAELGDTGVLNTRLNLTVAYDTGQYQGQLAVTTPIVLTESAYWFDQDLTDDTLHFRTTERTVRAQPDLALVAGLELVGLLALAAAAALFVGRRKEDLTEIETALAHERYEEWISEGEVPTQTDKKFVHINSLEDLVDVAIDSNKRVLHDIELSTYAVVDGDIIYYHSTDRSMIDSWLGV